MAKNFLLILFVVIVLAGGVSGYLFYHQLRTPPNKAIKAIPANAALIIESQDFQKTWDKLDKNTLFWRTLAKVDFIKKFNKSTRFLDSLLSAESKVAMLIKGRPSFVSALTGA